MLKVQTTISPRRKRSALLASARSAAEEDASGYSPPTPYLEDKGEKVERDLKTVKFQIHNKTKSSVPTCKSGRDCAHPKMNCDTANMMAQPWMVTPLEAVSMMPPTNMKEAVSAEPHLRPIWSAM